MSEVEKMYKLADVQPQYKKRIECKEGHQVGQPCGKCPCIDCDKSVFEDVMPPFTAEKQIELIKWLLQNKRLCIQKAEYSNNFYMDTLSNRSDGVDNKDFEQCLGSLVNNIWQSLTEEEKQQVKGILE